MKPDTLLRLSALFEEMKSILEREAARETDNQAREQRSKTIRRATDHATRLMTFDGLDMDAATEAAAIEFDLTAATVRQNVARLKKVSIRSRLAAAERKRQTGASARSVSIQFAIPKSTLHDRLKR